MLEEWKVGAGKYPTGSACVRLPGSDPFAHTVCFET